MEDCRFDSQVDDGERGGRAESEEAKLGTDGSGRCSGTAALALCSSHNRFTFSGPENELGE